MVQVLSLILAGDRRLLCMPGVRFGLAQSKGTAD